MTSWQQLLILIFGIFNFCLFFKAFYEVYKKKNAYGETRILYPLSMYVWGDVFIFSLFFVGVSALTLILSDWLLFLLFLSLFWLVRSIGETIYWFNQQFSTVIRVHPEKYATHKIFHNDSVWFIFQIMNQCLTVITIITSLYLAKLWLATV